MGEDKPIAFNTEGAKRIIDSVRWTERFPRDGTGDLSQTPRPLAETIIAKITSVNSTNTWQFGWEERRHNNSGTVTVTDGRTGTDTVNFAFDPNRRANAVAVNDIVALKRVAWETSTDTFETRWQIIGRAPLGELFRVNLSFVSGSSPSFTYTVKTLDNNVTLGTGMSPEFRPFGSLPISSGSKGTGYFNSSGTFTLATADEVIQTQACSTP